jgi:hypothetical protein
MKTMKTEPKSKPGPKGIERVMKTFRFPKEIADRLERAAQKETTSEANIVQQALREWFRRKQIE